MGDFEALRQELAGVENISALSRVTGLSRDHLQRIRDGKVENTTIKTVQTIRTGIQKMKLAAAAKVPVAESTDKAAA